MLRLGNRIRLTSRDVARFTEITGFVPENVKTLDDLDDFVRRCKRYYWGQSRRRADSCAGSSTRSDHVALGRPRDASREAFEAPAVCLPARA